MDEDMLYIFRRANDSMVSILEMMDARFEPSHGQPKMSDEDIKRMFIDIRIGFQQIEWMTRQLAANEEEKKKRRRRHWKFW